MGGSTAEHMLAKGKGISLKAPQVKYGKKYKDDSTHNSHEQCAAIQIMISFVHPQFFFNTTAERAGIYNLSHSLWSAT